MSGVSAKLEVGQRVRFDVPYAYHATTGGVRVVTSGIIEKLNVEALCAYVRLDGGGATWIEFEHLTIVPAVDE